MSHHIALQCITAQHFSYTRARRTRNGVPSSARRKTTGYLAWRGRAAVLSTYITSHLPDSRGAPCGPMRGRWFSRSRFRSRDLPCLSMPRGIYTHRVLGDSRCYKPGRQGTWVGNWGGGGCRHISFGDQGRTWISRITTAHDFAEVRGTGSSTSTTTTTTTTTLATTTNSIAHSMSRMALNAGWF